MNITSFALKIKEGEEHKIVVSSARHVGNDGTASGIINSIETTINNLKKWLDRWREFIEDRFPESQHDMPSSNALHLVNLHGKFVTNDTCNTARKVGRDLCARIDAVTEEKNAPLKVINNKIIKITIESCQHYQWNICLDALSK